MSFTSMKSQCVAALLAAAPLAFADTIELDSSKRGLGYIVGDGQNTADDTFWNSGDLTWYYNWSPSPTNGIDLEFVPMLWGSSGDDSFYDTVKSQIDGGAKIKYVLGFNEPDGCSNGGSCVDAQTAAQVWIDQIEPLKKMDVQLGAPAVTGSPNGFTWLENFFDACDGGCNPDFIPVHWYGNFEGMASHMGQVNGTYPNMTMWVTEFGYPNVDLDETQDFFNMSISYLDRLDYVDRYAWFGAFRSDVSNIGPNNAFLTSKGKLTDMGANYLGQEATGNIPSSASTIAKFAGSSVVVLAAMFWSFA